jgi:adenylate cyclase
MERDHLSRKLAVILHADVVGSTMLVQQNEILAHKRIQAVFNNFSETIKTYGGIAREIRGDALVAEFERASDAVTAAIAFQAQNEKSNATLNDEIRPVLRIGVSLGEVIIADNTITGAGVVLAQRLEQIATPGSVVVQGSVYETVPTRMPLKFESLGEQSLKGFDQPIKAYAVELRPGSELPSPETETFEKADDETTSTASDHHSPVDINEKPSIAVLPFANMSGDPEQAYFCDGIVEDIITELSHFKDLSVISRHSSFAFRGDGIDIVEVGKKLNVHYVLEGSIRKSGNRVRVTAQLIDAWTGAHVWANRFDRELEDIFSVQDEVVRTISATLMDKVHHADHELAKRKSPSNLKAYDCVVLGLNYFYKWTPENNQRAQELFEQAVSIDPEYASAYAWLSEAHFRAGLNIWSASFEKSFSLFFDYASKSVVLDDNDSHTHTALGLAYLFRGDHDLARSHLDRALALNPSNTDAMVHLARCEALSGNPKKGVEHISEALRFNPFANYQWFAGQVHFIAGQYEEAIRNLSTLSSPNALVHAFLAASHGQLGNDTEARASASLFTSMAQELVKLSGTSLPQSWVEFIAARYPFKYQKDAKHFIFGLKKAGLS